MPTRPRPPAHELAWSAPAPAYSNKPRRQARAAGEHLTDILAEIYDKLDEIARSERRTTIVELDPPRLEPRP